MINHISDNIEQRSKLDNYIFVLYIITNTSLEEKTDIYDL